MVEYGWGTLSSWAGCEHFPRQEEEFSEGRTRKRWLSGTAEMLSRWSSSVLREGWENKTRQVGQCKRTAAWRETERRTVNVWGWRKKERSFAWRRREASGIFGAEYLQKGQREQESNAGDGFCLQRLLLFCWTSQLFLTGCPRIETAYGLPVHLILRTAAKRKLHRNGFPQTSKKSDLVHSHLDSLHFHELLAGVGGPRLSVLLVAHLFAKYSILKQYAT